MSRFITFHFTRVLFFLLVFMWKTGICFNFLPRRLWQNWRKSCFSLFKSSSYTCHGENKTNKTYPHSLGNRRLFCGGMWEGVNAETYGRRGVAARTGKEPHGSLDLLKTNCLLEILRHKGLSWFFFFLGVDIPRFFQEGNISWMRLNMCKWFWRLEASDADGVIAITDNSSHH